VCCEVKELVQLIDIDWWQVFIAICLLVFGGKALLTAIDWFLFDKLKIETGKMKQQREDHEKLKTTYELAKQTAENLDKLQQRHTKDEEEFRKNLSSYIEESREDRKALHEELTLFNQNRASDRQVSIDREKKLNDRITESNECRDKVINDINNSLNKLTDMFVDKNIEDMRWEILNFCSALTSGRKYNKESFNHVIQIHEKYEKILEENNMENGQVTASMEVIMDVYKEKLKNGFEE
jgi:hypothetical protein